MIGDNDIYPLVDDPTTTTNRPPYLYRDWTLVLSGNPKHITQSGLVPPEFPTPHSMAAHPTGDDPSTARPHRQHRPGSTSTACRSHLSGPATILFTALLQCAALARH